jgi:hypothetical protein
MPFYDRLKLLLLMKYNDAVQNPFSFQSVHSNVYIEFGSVVSSLKYMPQETTYSLVASQLFVCMFSMFIYHYLIISRVNVDRVRIWSGSVCRLHNLTTSSLRPEDGDVMFLKTLLSTYKTTQCHCPEVHS